MQSIVEFLQAVNPRLATQLTMERLDLMQQIATLRTERDTLAKFAREFIRENCWDDYSEPDGGDVQDRAVALGILVEVEGGYDPEKHSTDAAEGWGAEKGDQYFTFAPFVAGPPEVL